MSEELPKEMHTEGDNEIVNQEYEDGNEVESGNEKSKDSTDEYTKQLGFQKELERRILKAEEESLKNNKDVKNQRKLMGLPLNSDFVTVSNQYLERLREQEKGIKESIENGERGILGAPEGKGENLEIMERKIEAMEREMKQENAEMAKESREKYIQDYVDFCIKDMSQYFQLFLNDSENGDKAMKLMKLKTTTEINNRAEDFIENGARVEIGFRIELTGEKFDKKDRGQVQYITEVKFTFDDYSYIENKKNKDEQDLVNSGEKRVIDNADERGDSEEVKK